LTKILDRFENMIDTPRKFIASYILMGILYFVVMMILVAFPWSPLYLGAHPFGIYQLSNGCWHEDNAANSRSLISEFKAGTITVNLLPNGTAIWCS